MAALTLIVPCFNEAARLDAAAFRDFDLARAGGTADDSLELLFVDDGSSDTTSEVLHALVRAMPGRASVLVLPVNGGKAEAVRRGMIEALTRPRDAGTQAGTHAPSRRPDYVGFWDADLATPLNELPRFFDVLRTRKDVDFVLGSRVKLMGRKIERRPTRHYFGRVFATAASLVLQMPIYDTQCGAKVLRVDNSTLDLFAERFVAAWVFDVELLARFVARAKPAGASAEHAIYELPLRTWVDVAGSKVRPLDFVKSAADLAMIGRKYKRQ